MKRKIISIDEKKCTGCGLCIPDCPEGALQVIEGKARIISDLFCDGLGACIGTCPEGAIQVIEREAEPYNESSVMQNIVKQGPVVITAHLEHLLSHGEHDLYRQAREFLQKKYITIPDPQACGGEQHHGHHQFGGCPGSAAQSIVRDGTNATPSVGIPGKLELRQWPVQLKLLNPKASYFDNADLLVAADCVPIAYAGFHQDFLKGKIVIIFCPKLDADLDEYIEKLSLIFKSHPIQSLTVVHMEVPCCSGVIQLVSQAMKQSEQNIPMKEVTITIDGKVK